MKNFKRLTAMLLAMVMVFALAGCGGKAVEKLYGTWAMTYDMGDMIKESMGSDYEDFECSLNMEIRFDFNEDGTFKMYVNQEALTTELENWVDYAIAYGLELMYVTFEDAGITREQADELFVEQYGQTIEEYMREMMDGALDVEALCSEMEQVGVYDAEGDKLFMTPDEEEVDKSFWDIFTVEGDTLTIDKAEDSESQEVIEGFDYPFVLTKMN